MRLPQLYNFGETVSLVFWTESWRPESFYDKICKNRKAGLHTLCLLGATDTLSHTHNYTQTPSLFLWCLDCLRLDLLL